MAESHKVHNVYDDASDWQEFFDESTGRNYYANLVTRETTWEMPESLRLQQEREQARAKQPPVEKTFEMFFPQIFFLHLSQIQWPCRRKRKMIFGKCTLIMIREGIIGTTQKHRKQLGKIQCNE